MYAIKTYVTSYGVAEKPKLSNKRFDRLMDAETELKKKYRLCRFDNRQWIDEASFVVHLFNTHVVQKIVRVCVIKPKKAIRKYKYAVLIPQGAAFKHFCSTNTQADANRMIQFIEQGVMVQTKEIENLPIDR